METYRPPRIALTRAEKQLLRALVTNSPEALNALPPYTLAGAARGLVRKELARAAYEEGGAVVDVRPTDFGRSYFAAYPSLRNPIPWGRVLQWAGVVLAAASVGVALFACKRLGLL